MKDTIWWIGPLVMVLGYYLFVHRFKWLTIWAYLGALLLAILIVLSFGIAFLVYPLVFLISGSVLSKIQRVSDEFEDKKGRNGWQVFANGGAGMTLCVLNITTTMPGLQGAFILAFCIAISDTWSSELGKMFGQETVDIIKWKKVERGLSGGISFAGTMAGLLGSFALSIFAYMLGHFSLYQTFLIGGLGFVGMLIDSVYGSLWQGKYLEGNTICEVGSRSNLIKGHHWITNNKVNFLSIATVILIYILMNW